MPGIDDTNVGFTEASLIAGAKQDKLVVTSPPNALPDVCPGGDRSHYLAICLREQTGQARDFHCLRLDGDGRWSHMDSSPPHKWGALTVRNTDDTHNVIADLRTARFKNKLTFVGFFVSTEGKRVIEQ